MMAILIGAICVTAFRIRPRAASSVASPTAEVTEQAATPNRPVDVHVRNLSRNPFRAPDEYSFAQARCNAAELGLPIPGEPGKSKKPGAASAGTLPPVQPVVFSAVATGEPGDALQAKPTFSLMATIKDAGGLSAVMKCNDSIVRVVNVGDTLEGGYKVRTLKVDRAVLSNGEDTIVVKKPQL